MHRRWKNNVYEYRNVFSFWGAKGLRLPDPFAPGPHWGQNPQTSIIALHGSARHSWDLAPKHYFLVLPLVITCTIALICSAASGAGSETENPQQKLWKLLLMIQITSIICNGD